MSTVVLDAEMFKRRAEKIRKALGRPLLVMLGKSEDVVDFGMNSALFLYLLNYEFPETLLVIGEELIAVTSARKAELLKGMGCMRVVVRNKDNSNMEEVYRVLGEKEYCIVDEGKIRGDLCRAVLGRVRTEDVSRIVEKVFLVKDEGEIERCRRCADAVSVLMKKGLEMTWEGEFGEEKIEGLLEGTVGGVDTSLLEPSFPVESTRDMLRIGLRYAGYCTEASRTIVKDMRNVYIAQDYILGLVKIGVVSGFVYREAERYFKENGLAFGENFVYCVGLMSMERSFKDTFVLEKNVVFVVNLRNDDVSLSNTFVVGEDGAEYLTLKDGAVDFVDTRPRFRNKVKEYEMSARRKEHQKELLERLIEQQREYYRNVVGGENAEGVERQRSVVAYGKESAVPRTGKVVVDTVREVVVIPIGSYAVPFHVSNVRSVSANEENVLRINFKAGTKGEALFVACGEEEGKEALRGDGEGEGEEERGGRMSFIRSVNVRDVNAKETCEEINRMKKSYSTKTEGESVVGGDMEELDTKTKPYGLMDVYMKTDVRVGGRKKGLGNLELHRNGFRFSEGDVRVLFSNVRHIFFCEGSADSNTILHMNLSAAVMIGGRKTRNIQFYQDVGVNVTYDTGRRGGERMEYIQEVEEEEKLRAVNARFREFVRRIEDETETRVQYPRDGFQGVPFKECVQIKQTHECLVSVEEAPYLVLTLEDVEIVSFERVVFNVKTTDVVFIMRNKAIGPVSIMGVDVQEIGPLKEYLDSNNVLFMETSVNIQWGNLIRTIMKDPVSFYENGAWSELMVGDGGEEEEEESEELSEESTSLSEEEDLCTDDDEVSDVTSEEGEDDEDEDESDDEDDEDESGDEDDEEEEEYERPKRRGR